MSLGPPPIPQPPHDPTSWLLDARVGWHQAQAVGLALDAGRAMSLAEASPAGFLRAGVFHSQALDSSLRRCQWHRVILYGAIPPGTSVRVSTYTAEAELTPMQAQSPDLPWDSLPAAQALAGGEWDALVRSGGGRYLWLRLEFFGNGKATPVIERIIIEFPRISLRRYLPAVFGQDPISADFTDRFLALFDTGLRGIEGQIDHQARYFDPLSAPTERNSLGVDFLSWLASWIGVALERRWPLAKQRQWVKRAGSLYALRGTREGLWRQLLLWLDMEADGRRCPDAAPKRRCCPPPANCAPPAEAKPAWSPPPLILEHYQLRRWLYVGAGRLGDNALLWGRGIVNRSQLDAGAQLGQTQLKATPDPLRDPFHVYAHRFTVFVPARCGRSEADRLALRRLLAAESPAHTRHHVEYVAPAMRVGVQCLLGFDTVVGRPRPDTVTLGETPLGAGSLPADASIRLGRAGHVGGMTL